MIKNPVGFKESILCGGQNHLILPGRSNQDLYSEILSTSQRKRFGGIKRLTALLSIFVNEITIRSKKFAKSTVFRNILAISSFIIISGTVDCQSTKYFIELDDGWTMVGTIRNIDHEQIYFIQAGYEQPIDIPLASIKRINDANGNDAGFLSYDGRVIYKGKKLNKKEVKQLVAYDKQLRKEVSGANFKLGLGRGSFIAGGTMAVAFLASAAGNEEDLAGDAILISVLFNCITVPIGIWSRSRGNKQYRRAITSYNKDRLLNINSTPVKESLSLSFTGNGLLLKF